MRQFFSGDLGDAAKAITKQYVSESGIDSHA